MPNFCHPGQPPTEIYPDRATRLIEELRRFVGHDRLVQQTNHYHAEGRITNLVRMARFREDQPLIEAFEKYEKATRRRQRSLLSFPDEILYLSPVEALFHLFFPILQVSFYW